MDWDIYWEKLVQNKRLAQKIEDLNQVDKLRKNDFTTEKICHTIYDNYFKEWKPHLEEVKSEFLKLIDQFKEVHLQTNRIKNIDSLLVKVINKRYDYIADFDNLYSNINGTNYKNIITDLIGMRLIINYRGKWQEIHSEITEHFPYADMDLYKKYKLIPFEDVNRDILAEIPTVYYAAGDRIDEYGAYEMVPKQHSKGYRSIHYVVLFKGVYIEIQVRTIYDEAWSDCDHNYVYKQDENKSHTALECLSKILCELTNISNDMGDNMRDIFEDEKMVDQRDGTWKTTQECVDIFDEELKRVQQAYEKLESFRTRLIV